MLNYILTFLLKLGLRKFFNRNPKQMSLLDIIDESRLDWQNAINDFNLGSRDITDYLIYKVIASEKRYMILLNQARAEKLTAWPEEQANPAILVFDNGENVAQDQ